MKTWWQRVSLGRFCVSSLGEHGGPHNRGSNLVYHCSFVAESSQSLSQKSQSGSAALLQGGQFGSGGDSSQYWQLGGSRTVIYWRTTSRHWRTVTTAP